MDLNVSIAILVYLLCTCTFYDTIIFFQDQLFYFWYIKLMVTKTKVEVTWWNSRKGLYVITRPDIATSTWSYSEQQDEIELFHWNLHSNINISTLLKLFNESCIFLTMSRMFVPEKRVRSSWWESIYRTQVFFSFDNNVNFEQGVTVTSLGLALTLRYNFDWIFLRLNDKILM